MAISIGKRKRQQHEEISGNTVGSEDVKQRKRHQHEDESSDSVEDEDTTRALFQRAFEAKFKPLQRSQTGLKNSQPEHSGQDTESEHNSDWSGLSEDEESVQTIRHAVSSYNGHEVQKHERKAFMSSKPPSSNNATTSTRKPQVETAENDPAEVANKKHDLALQRLLKESHLLSPNSFKGTLPASEGKGRLKALDLRLKDLGAKQPTSQQQKMPLSHRKGIVAKAADREDRRRKDALENGVVLEKAKTTSQAKKFREKGVGGSTIGKFRGGTLKLSSRDLRSVQEDKRKRRR